MYRIIDDYYGADADGNRSMPLTSYVIEEWDVFSIQQQLMISMDDSGELPSNPFTISLIEPITEEQVELEVNPFEYLSEQDCRNYLHLFGEQP